MEKVSLKEMMNKVLNNGWHIRTTAISVDDRCLKTTMIMEVVFGNKANKRKQLRNLIVDLLNSSEKDKLEINKLFDFLDIQRLKHVLICYLYGCYFYKTENFVKTNIDRSINGIWTNSEGRSDESKFLLSWLLISLFHDIGYSMEQNDKRNENVFEEYKVEELLELDCQIEKYIPFFGKDIPECYENSPVKYDTYRKISGIAKHKDPTFDHGIYGGIMLKKSLDKHNESHEYYMPKQFYDHLAWVIICHNMWFAHDDNMQYMYKTIGLDNLCVDKRDYRITIKKAPLLWLLSVVDNIETTKRHVPLKKMNNIYVNKLTEDKVEMYIDEDLSDRKVKKYYSTIQGLNDWLISANVISGV